MGQGMGNGVYLLKLMEVESESYSPFTSGGGVVCLYKGCGVGVRSGDKWDTADEQTSWVSSR